MAQLRNLKQISVSAIHPARHQRLRAINQNPPSSTKKPRTIVPPPQSARIMQRYVGGESIRQIAREEHETVQRSRKSFGPTRCRLLCRR